MEPFGIIYKVTNVINGMMYIGQTTMPLRDRWRIHCSKTSTCKLYQAISLYGKNNFIIEEIEHCYSRDELNEKECFWIQKIDTLFPKGYNIRQGGYSIVYSEASRAKMSKNHADVRGVRNPRYGARLTETTKQLISSALKGKYVGEKSSFHKAVINLDTNERFSTATEAANKYGVTVSALTKTCRGVQKRTAGCRWIFEGGDANDSTDK